MLPLCLTICHQLCPLFWITTHVISSFPTHPRDGGGQWGQFPPIFNVLPLSPDILFFEIFNDLCSKSRKVFILHVTLPMLVHLVFASSIIVERISIFFLPIIFTTSILLEIRHNFYITETILSFRITIPRKYLSITLSTLSPWPPSWPPSWQCDGDGSPPVTAHGKKQTEHVPLWDVRSKTQGEYCCVYVPNFIY